MIDLSALHKYSLFGGLLQDEIEAIKNQMNIKTFQRGQIILREGDANDTIYFILSGKVDISKKGKHLSEISEGVTFGEMELLDVMPVAATIRCLEPTTIACIGNRTLHDLSKTHTRAFALILMNLARDLSRRLRRMDELIAELQEGSN